jgi:hypothetical protein
MDEVNNRKNVWQLSCYLEMNDKITVFGEDMYVNLDFLLEPDKLEKDTLNRNHLYLGCKYGIKSTVKLKLPVNTGFSYNPELPVIDKSHYKLSANYSISENELIYRKKMFVESSIIKKEDFSSYIDFVNAYKKVQESSVELKKTNP